MTRRYTIAVTTSVVNPTAVPTTAVVAPTAAEANVPHPAKDNTRTKAAQQTKSGFKHWRKQSQTDLPNGFI